MLGAPAQSSGKTFSPDPDTMAQSTVQFLADQPLPLELKTIHVADDGKAARRLPDQLTFRFHFAGIAFDAAARRHAGGTRLSLEGLLGYLPYSAQGPALRTDVATIVASSSAMQAGRFVVTEGQEIRLRAEVEVETPITPVSLIAAAADILVNAKPWLDTLGLYLAPLGGRGSAALMSRVSSVRAS